MTVDVVPLTLPVANGLVERWHRHHARIPPGFAWWCIGAVSAGRIVGCAIAGRPTNRNNDDRQTVEVLRLATDGTPNACSALLGACARAARAIGSRRIITYTLTRESGASLRAAGWRCEDADVGKSWWCHAGTRTPAVARDHIEQSKARWGVVLRDAVAYDMPEPAPSGDGPSMFSAPANLPAPGHEVRPTK